MAVTVDKRNEAAVAPARMPERVSDTDLEAERGVHKHLNRHEGLRIILRREDGVTARRALRRPFHFQQAPMDEITREVSATHNEYTTIRKGTFSRFAGSALDVVSFQTLVLDHDPPWTLHPILNDPLEVADRLIEMCSQGWVFRLLIGQRPLWGRFDMNHLATLRSVGITERAGEPDTRYFDLSFSEWRDARIKRKRKGKGSRLPTTIEVNRHGRAKGMNSDTDNRPVTVVMMAKEFYKSGKFADLIVRHNKVLWNWPHHRSLGDFVREKHGGRPLKVRLPKKPGD